MSYKQTWGEHEIAQALACYEKGLDIHAIAEATDHGVGSVKWLLNKNRLKHPVGTTHMREDKQIDYAAGEEAFIRAMLRARETGTGSEREIFIGVVKNKKPMNVGQRFQPSVEYFSGSGSAGALCADGGGCEGM